MHTYLIFDGLTWSAKGVSLVEINLGTVCVMYLLQQFNLTNFMARNFLLKECVLGGAFALTNRY